MKINKYAHRPRYLKNALGFMCIHKERGNEEKIIAEFFGAAYSGVHIAFVIPVTGRG